MTQSNHTAHASAVADMDELLAAVGIVVTEDGKARARRRLAEANARWTDEAWAEYDQHLRGGRAA